VASNPSLSFYSKEGSSNRVALWGSSSAVYLRQTVSWCNHSHLDNQLLVLTEMSAESTRMGERSETCDQKENSNRLPDCTVCHSIWRQFADPDRRAPDINLGSFEDALSHGCPKHTPLVKRFKDYKGQSVTLTESLSKLGVS
jgi:hypothetical protein